MGEGGEPTDEQIQAAREEIRAEIDSDENFSEQSLRNEIDPDLPDGVTLTDVSDSRECLLVTGPKAREVLAPLTDADLSAPIEEYDKLATAATAVVPAVDEVARATPRDLIAYGLITNRGTVALAAALVALVVVAIVIVVAIASHQRRN